MRDRLGWLDAPRRSLAEWPAWTAFAAAAARDGLDHVLVCGMGGSSLAPLVLADTFGVEQLQVLDSTAPAAVRAAEQAASLGRTLFLVVSKSGTTVETLAFYRYFAARADPRQFVAVTDPGTPLERLARDAGFRAVFPHPTDVGGRYSALTVVGMLPAALAGIDGRVLLERAAARESGDGRRLGAHLGAAARAGRDKLVLRPPSPVAALAIWIEQLVAESTGKNGTGVVPLVGDPVGEGPDRELVTDFSADPHDLGAEFVRWMYATVELCGILDVNAFDQPDVDEAKVLARVELERGPGDATPAPATDTPTALRRATGPGDYVAILAYLPPFPEIEAELQRVRAAWAAATGCATTLGFGPRYLHSTGQLHKGGPNTGRFLVITAEPEADLAVPGAGYTFGRLQRAQAMGDVRALLARGRKVAHVHLERWEDVGRLGEIG